MVKDIRVLYSHLLPPPHFIQERVKVGCAQVLTSVASRQEGLQTPGRGQL